MSGSQLKAEGVYVALPVKRPVFMQCDGLKVRVNPVNWTGFSMERPFLDQIDIEVIHGEQA